MGYSNNEEHSENDIEVNGQHGSHIVDIFAEESEFNFSLDYFAKSFHRIRITDC